MTVERSGSWFRGRCLSWDPDHQAIEQERQRWVYEQVNDQNELIRDLAVDPDQMYQVFYDAYVETGDPDHLRRMLEYVH